MKRQGKNEKLVSDLKDGLSVSELPENLSKNNIISAVSGDAQAKTKAIPLEYGRNNRIKKAVAVAAAFAVVLGSVAVAGSQRNKPTVVPESVKAYFSDTTVTEKPESSNADSDIIEENEPESAEKRIAPKKINDYIEIENLFLSYAERIKGSLTRYYTDTAVVPGDNAEAVTGAADDSFEVQSPESEPDTPNDFSGTNIQVAGVDEADILKNDGNYLYAVSTSASARTTKIRIIDPTPDAMKILSEFSCPGKSVREIYITGDTLTAICDNGVYYDSLSISAVFYDISDRSTPVKTGDFTQQGTLVSTRLTEGSLIILSTYNGYCGGYDEQAVKNNCVPGAGLNGNMEKIPTQNICMLPDAIPGSYLVATKIQLSRGADSAKTVAVLGGGSDVYCTKDTLYAVRESFSYAVPIEGASDMLWATSENKTQIYAFSISGNNISFKSSGTVEGTALNQFSMDEYNGFLRIATNFRDRKSGKVSNIVSVLNSSLQVVGKLSGIAPGETIKSARFSGTKAYLVTFLNTDPLFVIDLSTPTAPAILGELKLPGFSSYLHPISDTLLVGIGPDGDDSGMNGKLKVSLFDVSNPAKPAEVNKYVIDGSPVISEAYNNPKAFVYDASRCMLMFPVSQYRTNSHNWFLAALPVDTASKSFGTMLSYRQLNIADYGNILRGTYIGDTVYTFSQLGLCAFDRATQTQLSCLSFADVTSYNIYPATN